MSECFKINQVERQQIEQIIYRLMFNQRNYTFTDYVYADSREPVASGEFSFLIDNQGNTVKDSKVFDAIVDYIDREEIDVDSSRVP